ncbi:MAG: hypothetical protein GXO87_03360 [Chlorobi bacterium]|nr:hypothetical protein [Chlorobiota bacterium]
MFIRFIIYSVLFYFIIKIGKFFFRFMKGPSEPPKREVHDTAKPETIRDKDIIEADFEELTDEKEKSE